jgi:hypothetical protein
LPRRFPNPATTPSLDEAEIIEVYINALTPILDRARRQSSKPATRKPADAMPAKENSRTAEGSMSRSGSRKRSRQY